MKRHALFKIITVFASRDVVVASRRLVKWIYPAPIRHTIRNEMSVNKLSIIDRD